MYLPHGEQIGCMVAKNFLEAIVSWLLKGLYVIRQIVELQVTVVSVI